MSTSQNRVILRPNESWIRVDWRGLIRYSDLLVELVHRDFTAKYKQTILGPLWSIFNPLITTLVFTLLFGRVIRVPTNGVPPMLFYLCSLLGWTYFSNVLAATGQTLTSNARIFSKVYFPRLIPPIAMTVSNLISFTIQLVFFLVFFFWFKFFTEFGATLSLGPSVFLLPVIVLHMAMLGLGVGLLMSSMTAKYRDLQHLTGMIVQLWMYATPIIYPLSQIPDKWRWISHLNPMTAIVETLRWIFLNSTDITLSAYATSFGISCAVLTAGILAYQRMARTFVDTV